eukprot:scaffold221_cov122-Isochrysis_galbana.AAC.4
MPTACRACLWGFVVSDNFWSLLVVAPLRIADVRSHALALPLTKALRRIGAQRKADASLQGARPTARPRISH